MNKDNSPKQNNKLITNNKFTTHKNTNIKVVTPENQKYSTEMFRTERKAWKGQHLKILSRILLKHYEVNKHRCDEKPKNRKIYENNMIQGSS